MKVSRNLNIILSLSKQVLLFVGKQTLQMKHADETWCGWGGCRCGRGGWLSGVNEGCWYLAPHRSSPGCRYSEETKPTIYFRITWDLRLEWSLLPQVLSVWYQNVPTQFHVGSFWNIRPFDVILIKVVLIMNFFTIQDHCNFNLI